MATMPLSRRRIAAIFWILAVVSINRNPNKKYVKSEAVWKDLRPEIGREDLCKLASILDGDKRTAVSEVNVVPVERLSTDSHPSKIPRAIVHTLERKLLGSGAHREVHSVIDLELEVDIPGMSIEEECELINVEHLPPGVFADPFQLHRLQQQLAFKAAHIYGDVDLEQPAKKSFESIVELHQGLLPGKGEGSNSRFRFEVSLPLHARYPPPSRDSHSVLKISMPHILIYCREGDNVNGANISWNRDLCMYALWGPTALKEPKQTLEWPIPSGNADHSVWVANLTTLTAIAGVVAIFVAAKSMV